MLDKTFKENGCIRLRGAQKQKGKTKEQMQMNQTAPVGEARDANICK